MKSRAGLLAAVVAGLAACAAPPGMGATASDHAFAAGSQTAATAGPAASDGVPAPSPSIATPSAASPSAATTPATAPTVSNGSPVPSGGATAPVEGQEAGSAAVGERPPLPTLPETAVGSGVTDSGAATELARALAGETASDWRVLAGFVGSQWDDELTGTIDVLVDTITVQDGVAMGLVRNGSTTNAGPILVTAGDVQAEAMVPVVRPGEPVPFRLPLGGIDPAALSWSAVAPQAGEVARGLQLTSWWQRGVTDPGPADTYLWTEPEQGPQPIVVFGTATAVDGAVADVGVASAWLDADGHVIGVADGIVGQATLRTGAAADFVVATTGPDALDDAQLMLWGWGA